MIRSPILIIGCPRSGTTLLFNMLSEVRSLWSLGYESKEIIERHHHPRVKGWESGALVASDLTPESRRFMLHAFEQGAAPGAFWQRISRLRSSLRRNSLYVHIKQRGRTQAPGATASSALPQQGLDLIRAFVRARNRLALRGKNTPIRLIEKTPENCLRLPFLLALFPDARVLYLTRDGRSNVHSLLEGWMQPHLFPGYRIPIQLSIPGYARGRWAFTLIPGWRELTSSPLEEVCACQWVRCNEAVLAHRAAAEAHVPYLTLRYEDLVSSPATVLPRVAEFLEIDLAQDLGSFVNHLPEINAVSAPERDKWKRKNPEAIRRILPLIEPMMRQLGYEDVSV